MEVNKVQVTIKGKKYIRLLLLGVIEFKIKEGKVREAQSKDEMQR